MEFSPQSDKLVQVDEPPLNEYAKRHSEMYASRQTSLWNVRKSLYFSRFSSESKLQKPTNNKRTLVLFTQATSIKMSYL